MTVSGVGHTVPLSYSISGHVEHWFILFFFAVVFTSVADPDPGLLVGSGFEINTKIQNRALHISLLKSIIIIISSSFLLFRQF